MLSAADLLISEVGRFWQLSQPLNVLCLLLSMSVQTIRLDYALRAVGSGGTGMERASLFRDLLRKLKKLLSESVVDDERERVLCWIQSYFYILVDLQMVARTLRDLDFATSKLRSAFMDFLGITFNEKVMFSLERLSQTLRKVSSVASVETTLLKIRARHYPS